jgi:hypothetical protein
MRRIGCTVRSAIGAYLAYRGISAIPRREVPVLYQREVSEFAIGTMGVLDTPLGAVGREPIAEQWDQFL